MFNLTRNLRSYGGGVCLASFTPAPPNAHPSLRQFETKEGTLWHRVAQLYVDEFRYMVGEVLGLAVDRWHGVCPLMVPLSGTQ